jgi:hypothetical protein
VQTRDTKTVYRGPTAPVTSVAIGGQGGNTVFAGCWDKDIWSWDRENRAPGRRYKGHSDFVKVVICAKIGGKDVRATSTNCVTALILPDSPLCRRRFENHGLGYSNWRPPTYSAR